MSIIIKCDNPNDFEWQSDTPAFKHFYLSMRTIQSLFLALKIIVLVSKLKNLQS